LFSANLIFAQVKENYYPKLVTYEA